MEKITKRAKELLVGGVNSPVRSFNYVGTDPFFAKKAKGSRIYDEKDKAYIDYVLSFGANILGHAHCEVIKEAQNAIRAGVSYGVTTRHEVELAEGINKAIRGMEKIRFVNSGTEAVMGAVRLARGYTGRDKIIKFKDSYHGHADYFLVKSGSGLATLGIPFSKGVPREFIKHTLLAEYGNKDSVDRIFAKHGKKIAAIIVEPAGGNYGVIPPDRDFLKHIRKLSKKNGALLISDEIITGFRFSYGTLTNTLGIKPDLYCLGKIIGGGFPIGAYGGSKKIMKELSPEGQVYQASTFGGNPVVMRSGIATLKTLLKNISNYKKLTDKVRGLTNVLKEEAKNNGHNLEVAEYGSMFSLKFDKQKDFQKFYKRLLSNGVFLAPSEYEANFISFAHTQSDIQKTQNAISKAMRFKRSN
ncbi:MAG: glutamate-1-semialdehyde 2,1-aminomutase [Candidatus Aadella gelida]|nr:glutamate-1-semialdehyde 2,1-aminomutase [Candidatus Aadella gelida]